MAHIQTFSPALPFEYEKNRKDIPPDHVVVSVKHFKSCPIALRYIESPPGTLCFVMFPGAGMPVIERDTTPALAFSINSIPQRLQPSNNHLIYHLRKRWLESTKSFSSQASKIYRTCADTYANSIRSFKAYTYLSIKDFIPKSLEILSNIVHSSALQSTLEEEQHCM